MQLPSLSINLADSYAPLLSQLDSSVRLFHSDLTALSYHQIKKPALFGFTAPFALTTWVSIIISFFVVLAFALVIRRIDFALESRSSVPQCYSDADASESSQHCRGKDLYSRSSSSEPSSTDGSFTCLMGIDTIWQTYAALTIKPLLLPFYSSVAQRIFTGFLCWFALAIVAIYVSMHTCISTLQATDLLGESFVRFPELSVGSFRFYLSSIVSSQRSKGSHLYLVRESSSADFIQRTRSLQTLLNDLNIDDVTYVDDITHALSQVQNDDVIVTESYTAGTIKKSTTENCEFNVKSERMFPQSLKYIVNFDSNVWNRGIIQDVIDDFEQELFNIQQR